MTPLNTAHVRELPVYAPTGPVAVTAISLLPILVLMALSSAAFMLVALSLGALLGAAIAVCIARFVPNHDSGQKFGAWEIAGVFAFVGFGAGMIVDPQAVLQFFDLP